MRKPIALFASLILALHLSACTSGDSKEDGTEDGAVAESTEGTDADLANLDAPPADEAVASTDGANEGFLDEQLPEDALGESKQAAVTAEPPPADIAENTTPPPAMEETKPTEAAPIETPADTSVAAVDTGSAPTDTTSPALTDTSAGVAATASTEPALEEPAKPKMSSLKKIESAPITREGVLLNAVYIARSGDNYKKISKLIYGSDDKVKELKKVNPSVKPKVGDKIYYNSPVRPTDDTKLLTYYEDAGLVPDVYIAKEGDDLKKVSKELLGHKDAWKEVWATNMIDSKDVLAAGTELRYWKSAPAPAPTETVAAAPTEAPPKTDVAMNTPPPDLPPPPVEAQAAQPMPEATPTPPPPAEMAPPPPPPVAEMAPPPPPPPPAEMAPEVPPPPPAEALNPPPPPPVAKKAPPAGDLGAGGMDNDMMMSLAGAGIIAAGLAAVIIIRKRRQNRDMAQAFNDTQVGT